MFRILSIAALSVVLMASSCRTDKPEGPTANLDLQFVAKYGNAPLVMYEKYDYNDSMKVFYERFNFFISNVALVAEGAQSETELIDIDFLSFDEIQDVAAAEAGRTLNVTRVPVGRYQALRIGVGVPADLNIDADYSPTHPLGEHKESHYWSGWSSYIFAKIEGKGDTNGDGQYDDVAFSHHLGTNELYQTVELPIALELVEGQDGQVKISIDVRQLYVRDNGMLDLVANPGTHTDTQLEVARAIMERFHFAMQVE